jgi:SEFIR domain.
MSKVFVSYSHDSAQHEERVLQFANALLSHGVEVELDRYHVRPPKGWPHWCEEQLRPENSDFVLMICTETYLKRVQGKVPADEGLGVFWEGSIIYDYIYDARGNQRFIPVLLDDATNDYIPVPIRNHTRYHIASFDLGDTGYQNLYRELTAQPFITKPALGQVIALPAHPSAVIAAPLAPRPVQTTFPIIAPSRLFRSTSSGSDLLVGREDELSRLDAAWSGAEKKNVVTIVAWGGVGKTSLVARWAASTLAKENHGGIERYFDWSFYSQGTRTDGDATGADKAASADIFIKDALEFFGDPDLAASNAGAWQKGERLARLVAEHRTLLILDGLEPLQDAKVGDLRDEALRALLRGLAANNRGLCLVTTRQQLPELNTFHATTAPEWQLAKLSREAGAELLKELGVKGTPIEREQLAADVKGHALTLTLLGKYLAEAHGGDIRKRDLVSLTEADYEETSGHAFHVMETYERWLNKDDRHVELAILRLLGLFDRPATPDCLAALLQAPAIPGLTDTLVPLTDAQWNLAVTRLVRLGLVEEQPWEPRAIFGYGEELARKAMKAGEQDLEFKLGEPRPFPFNSQRSILNSIEAHPVIREYFDWRLRVAAAEARRTAHSRLYEQLRDSVPYWPEGLDGLQPLYQAVAHGCRARRHQEACIDVYQHRILRGTAGPQAVYSVKKLGALGTDLSALGSFFIAPWTRLAPELTEVAQAWLLNEAAYRLGALGRLTEALEPMRESMDIDAAKKEWEGAGCSACNLSELHLTLGDVMSAVLEAEQSVTFADRSGDSFVHVYTRTAHADALHQAGRVKEARARFEEAEFIQRDRYPGHTLLHSVQGFKYCEVLLADSERAAWSAFLKYAKSSAPSVGDSTSLVSNAREIGVEGDGKPPHCEALHAFEQRASQLRKWVKQGIQDILSVALDHLTLGRVALYRRILDSASFEIRNSALPLHIETAIHGLRQSRQLPYLPPGLLTSAWLCAVQGQTAAARADLDEAQQIAERGPMPLHLADVHLHRARLFFRDDLAAAREDLVQARALIVKHGYLRRMEELEDAEKVILADAPLAPSQA